jgi:multiple sugar transport system ATP-binding protein
MAEITVRNLRKEYEGRVQALKGVSFQVQDGEFFCLLGPAGAGKTTTIQAIAGIEPVDEGEIRLDDETVTDAYPWVRDVAVAFETYALYPQRTVRENLRFPLEAPFRKHKWPEEVREKRTVEVANMLGIGELLERFPRQLSGGQRQRVALGRALVRKPRAYLLDEPIAHLDAKLRHRMRGELKRIQLSLGISMLYATPDQLEALSLADHIAVLNEGRIEQAGTARDVYLRPANVFVARFVGDPPMNIVDVSTDGDDLLICVDGTARVPMGRAVKGLLSQGAERAIKVGIRPKDLRLVAPTVGEAQVKAEVERVQVMGESSVLTLRAGSLGLRAKLATERAPERGSNVGLLFDVSKCHFFDAATGLRIQGHADPSA